MATSRVESKLAHLAPNPSLATVLGPEFNPSLSARPILVHAAVEMATRENTHNSYLRAYELEI